MLIKHFRPDCVTLFGRAIAREPLSFSREVLVAVTGDDFPGWFKGQLSRLSNLPVEDLVDGEEEPPMPDEPFTKNSFRDAPKPEMKKMREIWRGLTPYQAGNPAIWTYINLRMIECGLVESWFFVDGPGSKDKVFAIVYKALHDNKEKEIKKLARSVARFLTGYVPERSMRPLYSNCPPARAWWMWHIAEQAGQAGILQGNADNVFDILRESWVWGELTSHIVSRLTVIGDVNVRHGILQFLLSPNGENIKGRLRPLLRDIGGMSSWRALGFLPPNRVAEILNEEIVPTIVAQDPVVPDDGDKEESEA